MTHQPTLRERLAVRYGNQKEERVSLKIPPTGRIDAETVARVQRIAESARSGDMAARDQLFVALRPRLNRISWVLKPWPNSPGVTGIWDRDDVRQETWLVFAELLAAWDGKVGFIPYLLARFTWRLRDRILRGIGKQRTQYGTIQVSEEMLAEILVADDGEQPESVAMARKLLEELIRRQMMGASEPGELDAWLELINSREESPLVSPDQLPNDSNVSKTSRVA